MGTAEEKVIQNTFFIGKVFYSNLEITCLITGNKLHLIECYGNSLLQMEFKGDIPNEIFSESSGGFAKKTC